MMCSPFFRIGSFIDDTICGASGVAIGGGGDLIHKVHIDHLKDQILRDPKSTVQTRGMAKKSSEMEPKKVAQALNDESWVEAMQEELLQFSLQKNGYRKETIDKTLFIKKDKDNIMLVQVYVDDIIFGSTKKSLCDEFEALMHKRFQMSYIRELTFFLGQQVKYSEEGIFISQDKYVDEILKKFDFSSIKTSSTLIETRKPLVKDKEPADVDVHLYRSMISSLMYLTVSRPDIMFAVCACSRFQVTPKLSHLHDMKRIFRRLSISWQEIDFMAVQEADYILLLLLLLKQTNSQTTNDEKHIHVTVDGKTVVITESSERRDLLFTDDNGITCLTNTQIFENIPLMGVDVEAVHKEGVTVWCEMLLLLAYMLSGTVVILLRSNPRRHLMSLILKEKVQVVVPGAKKPWGCNGSARK
nr:putative ribonuclease H-like domain-containing protein [Tanacetum cinerariifolium]